MKRLLWWLPGPILALALVTFAMVSTFRVVMLLVCIVGAALLMFVAPAIQWVLLATDRFRGRPAASCSVALLAVLIVLSVPFLIRGLALL